MSWAKASRSGASAIAWPPYLMTIVRPWNRAGQGNASTSAAAFAVELSSREVAVGRPGAALMCCSRVSWTYATDRSVVSTVAVVPRLQVEHDRDVRTGEIDEIARLAGRAVTADHHTVDGDVEGERVEGRLRGPGG